jgi:hypothetical protein
MCALGTGVTCQLRRDTPKRDGYHSNEGICQEERDMTRSGDVTGKDGHGTIWIWKEGIDMTGKEGLTILDGHVRKEGIKQEKRDKAWKEGYGRKAER